MKPFTWCIILLFVTVATTAAQDFVTRGKIEFEIKRNNKKVYGENNADNPFIAGLPAFDISYRDLIFSANQSIYQAGRKGAATPNFVSEASVYTDLDKQQVIEKKRIIDENYLLTDSVKKIKWKIEAETRKIAGWECRKAVGRIYDSVYVVAFYCPEIIPQGGPELFNGLPGMILGIAIPRYYTTWFATKVEIANIDESVITPPTIKKGKTYGKKELAEIIFKKYKDLGWWKDATLEKVMDNITRYTL